MSRFLHATCNDDKVMCEGVEIKSAIILSEGNGNSSGLLMIQDDKAYYFPSNALDLKMLIEKIVAVLTTIKTGLNNIDTNGYIISSSPDTPGGPKAAGEISGIQSAIDDLNTFKGDLQ